MILREESNPLLLQTRKLLRRFGLHARKGLGQHFLVDQAALRVITGAAELTPDDTVVEVGPGLGVLTEELAGIAGRVVAIEIDPRIASILTERFSHRSNVTIVSDDVLQFAPLAVFAPEIGNPDFSYKVVANLPYYIASAVIRHFLEAEFKPRCMVVMVQKEVAQSIVAVPGKMSILSVSVQLYGKPVIAGYVPAQSFYPPPKIDSAIVLIDVYSQPVVEVEGFFRVVRAGFSAPRKQLRNALAQGLSIQPNAAAEILSMSGISPQRRAETLSMEEWAELSRTVVSRQPVVDSHRR
ncbi:16S rRNA (adenine(1518)-N(6)/adenine(1519)-N(6))-dimethyltransferase RsmA [Dehalococcoidia bacterium]|nr:16S rRNA (adenine(1518)-N(6)/adenine(1519)-N(6))-dimethyltransferase RsmA [Dehalococcoidia bacterium]